MKIKFQLPRKTDIIVFDEELGNLISNKIINNAYSCQIMKSRIDLLYINPIFILYFIKNLFLFITTSRKIFSTIYKVYILTIIRIINPKIVITYSDNNQIYHWLINAYPKISYIAIQNGIRQKFEIDMTRKLTDVTINHDHYYCFGQYDIDKHHEMGFTIKHPHPCGSLKLGLLGDLIEGKEKKYDICLLSNYKFNTRTENPVTKEISDNNELLDLNIARFIKETNKNIIIALRTESIEEKSYFQKIFGKEVVMTNGDTKSYSSYKASLSSKITIAFQSTLLIEMLALKCKVLHVDFTNNIDLFDYNEPIKYIYKNYKSFSLKLNQLFELNDHEYNQMLSLQKKHIMNFDIKEPPHYLIQRKIENIIKLKNEEFV